MNCDGIPDGKILWGRLGRKINCGMLSTKQLFRCSPIGTDTCSKFSILQTFQAEEPEPELELELELDLEIGLGSERPLKSGHDVNSVLSAID